MTHNTTTLDNASYLLRHGDELSSLGVLLAILSAISYSLGWVTLSLFTTLACPLLLIFGLITIRAGILEAGTNHERLVALGKSAIKILLPFSLFSLLSCIFFVIPLGWFSTSLVRLLMISSFALMCMTLVKSVQLGRG